MFAATNGLSRQKTGFVATKMILVAAPANDRFRDAVRVDIFLLLPVALR